jgi:hypothetical protein
VEGSGRVVGRGMAPVRPDAVRPAMGKKGSQRWGMTPNRWAPPVGGRVREGGKRAAGGDGPEGLGRR